MSRLVVLAARVTAALIFMPIVTVIVIYFWIDANWRRLGFEVKNEE